MLNLNEENGTEKRNLNREEQDKEKESLRGNRLRLFKHREDMQKHGSITACFPPLPTRAWIFTFYFIFLYLLCLI